MIPKKRHEHCFGNPSTVIKGGDALVGPKGGSFEKLITYFTPFIIGVAACSGFQQEHLDIQQRLSIGRRRGCWA